MNEHPVYKTLESSKCIGPTIIFSSPLSQFTYNERVRGNPSWIYRPLVNIFE